MVGEFGCITVHQGILLLPWLQQWLAASLWGIKVSQCPTAVQLGRGRAAQALRKASIGLLRDPELPQGMESSPPTQLAGWYQPGELGQSSGGHGSCLRVLEASQVLHPSASLGAGALYFKDAVSPHACGVMHGPSSCNLGSLKATQTFVQVPTP